MNKVCLNIAAGKRPIKGYINLDINPQFPGVTYGDALNLDWDDNTVDEIVAEHFIEHLTKDELNKFFIECYRILNHDGKIKFVAPSMELGIKKYCNNEWGITYLENLLFALQLHQHDYHKQGIYKDKLKELCQTNGFNVITIDYNETQCEIILHAGVDKNAKK